MVFTAEMILYMNLYCFAERRFLQDLDNDTGETFRHVKIFFFNDYEECYYCPNDQWMESGSSRLPVLRAEPLDHWCSTANGNMREICSGKSFLRRNYIWLFLLFSFSLNQIIFK